MAGDDLTSGSGTFQSAGVGRAGYRSDVSPLIDTPLAALASSLREFLASVEDLREANDGQFLDDAPAAVDWATNERPSEWGDQPLQDSYRTGALYWYLVREQTHAVCALLDAGAAIGILSAARALAEASPRCWWLLAIDVPPDERTRRMINDRLHGLYEDYRFAVNVPELDSTWQRIVRDRLLTSAAAMGIEVTAERSSSPARVGEARPSTMVLLGMMTGRPDYANLFYRSTSGVTHAGLHELVKHLAVWQNVGDAYRADIAAMSSREATRKVSLSIVAMTIAARALLIQAGWRSERQASAESMLATIVQALLDAY